jgi:hypothetical protein
MTFDEWLTGAGFDAATLTPTQSINLRLLYQREVPRSEAEPGRGQLAALEGWPDPTFDEWLTKLGFTGELDPTQRENLEQAYQSRYATNLA